MTAVPFTRAQLLALLAICECHSPNPALTAAVERAWQATPSTTESETS